MGTRQNPAVGVISESGGQRVALSAAVKSHGYELLVSQLAAQVSEEDLHRPVDVWLVDLPEEDEEFLDRLLETTDAPLLFGIEKAPALGTSAFNSWQRRVFVKLRDTVGDPVLNERLDELEQAEPRSEVVPLPAELSDAAVDGAPDLVCVLAASLGGPAAVKEFLDCLPAELPVAFVLAQHIDGRMVDVLPQVLGRHNRFRLKVAAGGDRLAHGEVLIAPIGHEIDFAQDGTVIARENRWDGPYSPSIDQLIGNVSRRFGKGSGALIFSGMGSDGSITGPQLAEAGGFVWAQTAETCACSSQPDSMRATACVSFNGSPAELATHLVEHLRQSLGRRAANA